MRADKAHALTILRTSLNKHDADFRDGQWEAIEALVERRARLLIVRQTGWGKSLVYFMATRLLREQGSGPALLISPLLALMRNQIPAAQRLGVRAQTLNSRNKSEWEAIQARLRQDLIDALIISPERLANDAFVQEDLAPVAQRVALLVIDEAHCISDWGHDFRPDYQRIPRIIQALPPTIPLLATTATANQRVVRDVVAQLGPELVVSRGPLARESLRLQAISLPSHAARLAWLAECLPALPGSGIIYTLTKRDADRVAAWLQRRGINASPYHADVPGEERERLEESLLSNEVKALIATSALGMGFDKPDLGFVIHYQRPGSAVHYYQQVGRAGRALSQAYGVLLGGSDDAEITEYFIQSAFPPEGHVQVVLRALLDADDGLKMEQLERRVNLSKTQLEKVLKMLRAKPLAPVATRRDKTATVWYATPVRYQPDTEKIAHLTAIRRVEQERMSEYLHSTDCLMRFLARELDDPDPAPCGRCAACLGAPLLPITFSPAIAADALAFLCRNEARIKPKKRWKADALIGYGWKGNIGGTLQAEEGRVLSVWGDEGWGRVVRQGKLAGRFADTLVPPLVDLVKQRWQPDPAPTWVTCVPSLSRPTLAPDLAGRLASALGLPFIPCVRKVRASEPQKMMRNSYQQARNLDGAFAVTSWRGMGGPVLLLDDMVDSGWTFTIIAALLRQAGSGPVYPLALADTSTTEDT